MSPSQPERPSDLSEEIISRDRAGLLGNVTLAVSGQGAAFAVGLLVMIVTARLLGPEGYGRLTMFFLVLAVLSQVLVSWPNMGLVRFGREEMARNGQVRETFGATLALFLINLVVAVGIVFIFQKRLTAYLNIGPASYLLLLTYLALNEFVFFLRALFQTTSNFRAYAAAAFLVRALNLAFIVLVFILLAKPASTSGILKAHIASISFVLVLCIIVAMWQKGVGIGIAPTTIRRIVAYAWPLMLGGLWILVVDWVDLALIRYYRPEIEVGWYAAAYQPVTVLGHMRIAAIAAIIPLLVSFAVAKRFSTLTWSLNELLPQVAWVVGLGGAFAAACVELLPFVLGAKYAPAVEPCRILMIAAACSIVAAFFEAIARATDRVGITVVVLAGLAATNVALDLFLIPRIGISGAAIATSIAFGVSVSIYLPCFNRIEQFDGGKTVRRLWILPGLAPPILCAMLASNLHHPLARAGACLGVVLLALVIARLCGVFRRETLDRFENVRMPAVIRNSLRIAYRLMDGGR